MCRLLDEQGVEVFHLEEKSEDDNMGLSCRNNFIPPDQSVSETPVVLAPWFL